MMSTEKKILTLSVAIVVAILAAALVVAQGGFDREAKAKPWGQGAAKQANKAAKAAASAAAEDGGGAESAESEDGAPTEATLTVGGEPGTEFSGNCAVGGEKDDLGGRVPQQVSYRFLGGELECEVRQRSAGALEVVLESGNDRSEQRVYSRGGTIELAYSGNSISSSTSSSGSSSSSSAVSQTSSSSSSSQIVSSSGADGADGQDGSSVFSQGATSSGGSGDVASESRDVSGFDEVELRGVGNLSIRQTGAESLTVKAQEDVLPKIRTEVEDGGRLVIGPEPGASISTSEPIDYELTVEDLHALKVSGAGNVEAEDIDTDELAVAIGGSGDVKICGSAGSQEIDISGSGDYRARHLESEEVKVDVGGAGSAVVNASEVLDAKVGGAGSVEYVGDPTVHKDVSGAGEVSKR